jgi:hypothetical protein
MASLETASIPQRPELPVRPSRRVTAGETMWLAEINQRRIVGITIPTNLGAEPILSDSGRLRLD